MMMNQGAKKAGYVSQPAAMDPRSTEAWALSEASRRLVVAAKADDNGKSLREALVLNQRLWTIFQTAMAEPDCPLPREIRDNVLALSIMMDRQILQRLGDLDGAKLQPILDINRCVAEGLAQKPQVPEGAVAQPMQANDVPPQPVPAVAGGARMAVNVSA
ncbi:flagellar biosynthesis regulator FlaF [Dongia sedimenti]|uniref:Flagellar biosynthesis regulator FlaF n=1 Tax=Dongia sedimenti TaxID=3064282 RepID=A0ABU0YHG3_9PROT|nr:flagellar biosynthesis regulator FlaF [Rhodospirillaceae bacterium R-7]